MPTLSSFSLEFSSISFLEFPTPIISVEFWVLFFSVLDKFFFVLFRVVNLVPESIYLKFSRSKKFNELAFLPRRK